MYDTNGNLYFLGCAHGTHTLNTPATGWERVRFDNSDAFPPIPPSTTVDRILIIFDEGTDQGVGYSYLDNIFIKGTLIGKPGNAK